MIGSGTSSRVAGSRRRSARRGFYASLVLKIFELADAPAELARRIGVTRQTVIAIGQGRYSPSPEMAFEIARVFGLPLDEVFQYPVRSGADEAGDGF